MKTLETFYGIRDALSEPLESIGTVAALLTLAEVFKGQPSTAALLTVGDAAKSLGVGPATVRRLVRAGRLQAHRLGDKGAIKIRPDDLAAFVGETVSTGVCTPNGQTSLDTILSLAPTARPPRRRAASSASGRSCGSSAGKFP